MQKKKAVKPKTFSTTKLDADSTWTGSVEKVKKLEITKTISKGQTKENNKKHFDFFYSRTVFRLLV